jgi:hypothetical protein
MFYKHLASLSPSGFMPTACPVSDNSTYAETLTSGLTDI